MTFSEIKELIEELESIDVTEWREVFEAMEAGEDDFEVENYRFINEDEIDEIQQEEMKGDEYILGCFNSWFLASVLDIDEDVIVAMQKAEAFEAVGKLVLSLGKLEELQEEYASVDGYGHHFNPWDGSDEEINGYHAFRVN